MDVDQHGQRSRQASRPYHMPGVAIQLQRRHRAGPESASPGGAGPAHRASQGPRPRAGYIPCAAVSAPRPTFERSASPCHVRAAAGAGAGWGTRGPWRGGGLLRGREGCAGGRGGAGGGGGRSSAARRSGSVPSPPGCPASAGESGGGDAEAEAVPPATGRLPAWAEPASFPPPRMAPGPLTPTPGAASTSSLSGSNVAAARPFIVWDNSWIVVRSLP